MGESHKLQGNRRLKDGGKMATKEALECFTAGLEVMCNDDILNAQLYSNRAHARMLLRQFVDAVDDCRKAIGLDPRNLKAYWRAAKASLHLDLCKKGVEFCDEGLRQEPNDADLMRLKVACEEKLATKQCRRTELTSSTTNAEFNAEEAVAVQDKVNELNDQLEGLRTSIIDKKSQHARANLTRKNLDDVPSDARTYVSVGRCFVLGDRTVIDHSLDANIRRLEGELPKLSKAHDELVKRKDGAEKELKEIIQCFKQHVDRTPASAA